MKPNGRPQLVSDAVKLAIAAAPGSMFSDLFAIVGGLSRTLTTMLSRVRAEGHAHVVGGKSHLRYFATAELAAEWVLHLPPEKPPAKPSLKLRWSPEDDAALLEHYPTKGAAFVADLLGRDINATYARACSKGIHCMRWIRNGVEQERKPAKVRAAGAIKGAPAPAKSGPAYNDLPADMSKAKVTILPTPVCRYAVSEDFRGMFSLAGIGRDVQTGNAW